MGVGGGRGDVSADTVRRSPERMNTRLRISMKSSSSMASGNASASAFAE